MEQHNRLNEAMIFNIKRIVSSLHIAESLEISEPFSWNPLAISLALTFNSLLIYFSEKTRLKYIKSSLQLSTVS